MQDKNLLQLRPTTHRVLHRDRLVLAFGGRLVAVQPYTGARRKLVELLAGGAAPDQLTAALAPYGPAAAAEATQILGALLDAGIIRPVRPRPSTPDRYGRTLAYLSQFATQHTDEHDLNDHLRSATIVVVGVGGLGSWLLAGLACLGVGELRLVDFDRVEASNLNRTLLVRERDVGSPKLESVARSLTEMHRSTRVQTFAHRLGEGALPVEVVDGADVVLSTADQPAWAVRSAVANACLPRDIPFLCPAGFRVGPFHTAPGDACVMCEFTRLSSERKGFAGHLAAQSVLPPSQPGSVPHIAAAVAGVVLQDVLRQLTGTEPPATRNHVWTADWNLAATYEPIAPHPDCVCQQISTLKRPQERSESTAE